ncbi:MAG: aldo/keto reductase [Saccharofermentanales bacterium]
MIYKPYGKTGKLVSALGFGGMRFHKDEYDKDPEICAEIVRYANTKGINYFDTAPYYCDDKSETIFGLAFKNMPGQFYVSTKSMITSDKTADDVRRRCENSIKRMNVGKIDFFHMWNILNLEQYNRVMAPGGPYEGAVKLKEEGLISHICISTHASGAEIKHIADEGFYEGVLLGYNATNFAFRQEGIKAAYEHGMGVVTMNPLGGGMIPNNPEFYSYLNEGTSDTLSQAALRFNISHKEISVALSGMGSREEIDENIVAAQSYTELSNEKMEEFKKHLNSSMDKLCTGCGYCNSCPEEIPIPKMMDSYNMKIITSQSDAVKNQIKYYWNIKKSLAGKCSKCGKCERLCTQHLPIIERLREIDQM